MTHLPFDNSYARLPGRFFTAMDPTPVRAPALLVLNTDLARDLGLDPEWLATPDGIAVLAGNSVPDGATPLAQVYAGHQFGGWSAQLGDGRALLLGELDTPLGRRDLQLKGSGPTPYSRMGDGRAWLGPVLREYLVSEAMAAMGIPTTRALAALSTGEQVYRDAKRPGAILTRIAASHIRVGTFQYFAARQDHQALQALSDHAIARHYPQATDAFDLLESVIKAQAKLVAQWMGVGFIHGVMNTDNMTISGETIDYGPCAFMDAYHPERVFSSIDQFGRYAYGRQPDIAAWNLAQLASSLLPLMGEREAAIARATAQVHSFSDHFTAAWLDVFRAKLGLTGAEDDDPALIQSLLDRMASVEADFTLVFNGLRDGSARAAFADPAAFDQWEPLWQARRARNTGDGDALMARANPAVIPRNHQIEALISAALAGDMAPFHAMHQAVTAPHRPNPAFAAPPSPSQAVTQTFCGT